MKIESEKIAIVHDFLDDFGGAERFLNVVCEMFPSAPIFTLLANKNKIRHWPLEENKILAAPIEESFLKKVPNFLKKRKKFLLPFMPTAIESLDFKNFSVVISSSSAFSKGIVIKPSTKHICYLHAPTRYLWDWHHGYLEQQQLKGKAKFFSRFLLNYFRIWDRASAERPDYLVANSFYTAKRIKKYYRRQARVIYPPVEVEKFSPQKENQGYFLTVGRLSPYKRIDLIVDVFKKLSLPLVVVGEGVQKKQLEKMAQQETGKIKILGKVSEKKLKTLYENCRAFVFAAEDDFGIAPVEAMAAGKPVIALRRGGTAETVIEGVSGEFFDEPEMEMLADGIRRFMENERKFNYLQIRKRAEEFSKDKFKEQFEKFLQKVL